MYIRNGITVNFAYSEKERKKFQEAEKKIRNYDYKIESKETKKVEKKVRKRRMARYKAEKVLKIIALIFFMIYEVVLVLKSYGSDMIEKSIYAEVGYKLTTYSNTIGFVFTLILMISILYFSISRSDVFGDTFFEVLGTTIKYFLKAFAIWAGLIFSIGILSMFVPKNTMMSEKVFEKFTKMIEIMQMLDEDEKISPSFENDYFVPEEEPEYLEYEDLLPGEVGIYGDLEYYYEFVE